MINWINENFNVNNDVSLPIIISLIVFITGGLVRYFFTGLGKYQQRKRLRKTFKMLNKQMIKDLSKKEKIAEKFYPRVSPKNREPWQLKHIPLNYLETYFQLNFQDIYYAFQKQLSWLKSRTSKDEAFHKIWSQLRNVQFFEEQKEKDIDDLIANFKEVHTSYNLEIVKLRKFHVDITKRFKKDPLFLNEVHLQTVIKYYFNIWKRFSDIDEQKRKHHFSTYNFLVRPLTQLAKEHPDHPIIEPLTPIVVSCEIKYNSIKNVLNLYRTVFKNHYLVYRSARRLVSKADKMI